MTHHPPSPVEALPARLTCLVHRVLAIAAFFSLAVSAVADELRIARFDVQRVYAEYQHTKDLALDEFDSWREPTKPTFECGMRPATWGDDCFLASKVGAANLGDLCAVIDITL
jgi:hypothetical protein